MRVAIVMGSVSDLSKVEPAILILKEFGVQTDVRCLSAHRAHHELCEFIDEANNNGTEVIIAAGTVIPVIGVPISGSVLDGLDALLSIAQMPPGIPVATVAINGSKNAAYLALQIIGNKHENIKQLLLKHREKMTK